MVPHEVDRRVIDTGLISGTAEWCGVKSAPHFVAMMGFERGSRRWTERRLTYIAALHGVAKGSMLETGKSSRCDDKVPMEALLKKRIGQFRAATPGAASDNATSATTKQSRAPADGPPISGMLKLFPAERINQMIATVRDNIHRLKLPDGSAIARESEAERAQALLPPETERRVVDAGMVSGVTEWCGVDPHMHFAAMMDWARGQRWAGKQLAYAASSARAKAQRVDLGRVEELGADLDQQLALCSFAGAPMAAMHDLATIPVGYGVCGAGYRTRRYRSG